LKDASGFWTGIRLRVENEGEPRSGFEEEISSRVREELKVRTLVEVHSFGSLPRAMHKAKRVVKE
jgi:phenylacetate-CoA ligase